jgi:glutaminyl-tRNA synthetase
LYIEAEDFMEDPPRKYKRLSPGREVRLRYAYVVKCTGAVRDGQTGEIVEVHCTYDPLTLSGALPDGRKVDGVIHWVSASHSVAAEVRLYDRLFHDPNPAPAGDAFLKHLNPASLETLTGCRAEPDLGSAAPGSRFQFERTGYFCVDGKDSSTGRPVFNRIVALRDSWARMAGRSEG